MRTMMASLKTALIVFLHWVLHYAGADQDVIVPVGPLYRVAGFPLTLPCNVSGYNSEHWQEFEFYLMKDDRVNVKIQVVSTSDTRFSTTLYQSRVDNGEVQVERERGDKVRFVIKKLQLTDEGNYECSTPIKEDAFIPGNYGSTTTVKVIADTLVISCPYVFKDQTVPECSDLMLACSSGISSEQLTHLSITFGKRGVGGTDREIISIDNMLEVVPGGSYKTRYDNGEITLEKRKGVDGQGLYVMKMRALQPDDTGLYFCEASQWIRDPDRSWQKIAWRTLDIGNLIVQQLAESLTVTASPKGEVKLQIGNPLILTCDVTGLPRDVNLGLRVRWMRRGSLSSSTGGVEVEVAQMKPDGLVTWGGNLDKASGSSMEKVSEGRYSLKLFPAFPADAGVYQCVVSVYAGGSNPKPSTSATITKKSQDVIVSFESRAEVQISAVAYLPIGPLLKRGSTITLMCNVTVESSDPSQALVLWKRWPFPEPVGAEPTNVAAQRYDGVADIFVQGSEVSVDRLPAGSYRLRIHAATMADQGIYVCEAEAWTRYDSGRWYNTGKKAQSNKQTVYLYARAADLLLIPLVVGVSLALFVGIVIIAAVTCCFMKRLARQRSDK